MLGNGGRGSCPNSGYFTACPLTHTAWRGSIHYLHMAHIPILLLLLRRSAKQWGLFKAHLEVESVIIMVLLTTLMHMAAQRAVRNALTLLALLGVGR